MMGSKVLSEVLKRLGFVIVFETVEKFGDGQSAVVGRGVARTYDINNGVLAIYDEDGRPWVLPRRVWQEGPAVELFSFFPDLTCGAYVPHSNDGGEFIRCHWPKES